MSTQDKSGNREASSRGSTRLLLAVLISAVFVSVLNSSMVNVVVPSIGEEFGASEGQVGWVITGYLLVYAVGIPLYGRISDLFSLRWTFCLGLLVFAAGSLFCALAPNLLLLVFGRILQAAGGAAIPALASASVAKVLPPGDRGTALGLIFSSVGIGAAVGPVLGGVVESVAGWQALFYGTLLLALIVIPIAFRELPHTERSEDRSFDLIGGVLLGLAAGLFLFGITQGEVSGFGSVTSWGSFVGAALAAAGFARRITSTPHPFVSPGLLKNTSFVAAVIVGFFSMLANVTCLVIIPLLISTVNELPSSAAALALTPGAIALAILSPFAGRLSDRVGVKPPIFAGLAVMLLSALFLSTFAAGASPIVVSAGMLGVGAGFAFANSPTTNAAAAALPQAEAGVGLGIFQGLFFLGGGTGPAVIGAFLAARREAGASALNPLYGLNAEAFSDAFLMIAAALALAFVASLKLREVNAQPTKESGKPEDVPAEGTESPEPGAKATGTTHDLARGTWREAKEEAMVTTNNAAEVARRAWEAWKHDVETGDPEPLIAMMTDDYAFMFPNPTERFRGQLYGKEEYRATSRWRWNDLKMRAKLNLDRITGAGNTYAFEWSIVSENRGQPYTNHMCIFFDVSGDKVSAHREYVNELDPEAIKNGAVEPSDAPPRRYP